jgi:broad specificity phosphatase PhoE
MAVALLLRHAQSEWNADGRWQGRADPELSPEGVDQALRAAARLTAWGRPDFCLASDLRRARVTAELLQDGPVETTSLLREHDVGDWSGLTREEVAERWPVELAGFHSGRVVDFPGGETAEAVDQRVAEAARHIAERAGQAGARRVLVVTHGGVLHALARAAGLTAGHIGHLSGFEARTEGCSLVITGPACLLDPIELPVPDSADADSRAG